jgi:hypothetical protein
MHRVFGFVLFTAGIGFILLGAYLLYVGYTSGLLDWEAILFIAGACLFGYLLAIAGYRMSIGERF